jgi:DNA gyrase/topoisomerase IV subunit B
MTSKKNDDIVKLSDYSHSRLRTEMYLGSRSPHTQVIVNWDGTKLSPVDTTWTPAAYCAFREILDNALDEVVGHGHGNHIDVTYDQKTMEFTVADDGRGIPIDWDASENMHKATMALTQSRAGRNFGVREEIRGTNGIGASVVVNCSEYFTVVINRDSSKFTQEFKEGSVAFDELDIGEPKIIKTSGNKTGTQIKFKLSKHVFKNIKLPVDFIEARMFEIAANHPKIKFSFNGTKVAVKPTIEKTMFADTAPICIEVNDSKFKSSYYLVPGFADEGEYLHTTVNDIPAFNGGQHIDTFKRLFYGGLIKALERESKRRSLTPNRSDIADGLLVYNVTTMHAPNFDSQSKTRLINDDVDGYIKTVLENEDTFKKIIRTNKEWIDQIYARCAARTQKKDDAELAKLGRKMMRNKVPKLLDANGKDRTKCILLLTEGDSAKTMVSAVRDPEIHGALPLRGKILNVRGENPKDIINNQVVMDLMTSIGLIFGQPCKREDLRYGKVYLAADQDPDGANITALLVNFFYLHWPELFDATKEPFFYAFMTPFIIQEKGKARHYWYAHDYHEYDPKDWKNCPKPTRAKGLGSLEEVDWRHSLVTPQLIPLIDDEKLSDTLALIFDPDGADARKEWIALDI